MSPKLNPLQQWAAPRYCRDQVAQVSTSEQIGPDEAGRDHSAPV